MVAKIRQITATWLSQSTAWSPFKAHCLLDLKSYFGGRCQMRLAVIVAGLLCATATHAQEIVVVEVIGVEGEVLDNVRNFLSIERLSKDEFGKPLIRLLDGDKKENVTLTLNQIRRAHRNAPKQIRQALQPFGYYEPKIAASLKQIDTTWHARYQIDVGVATTLAEAMSIEVQGDGRHDPALIEVLETLRSNPLSHAGALLRHTHYESSKAKLIDVAFNHGYVDANYVKSVILVDRKRHSAEIVLILETGQRYVFGPVTVNQEALRPQVLDRFIALKPGQAFDTRRLNELQIALESSGYFDSVVVRPEMSSASNGQVPVTVDTQLQKPRHYSAAFGLGTDTGPRLKLSADFRRINDRGHKIRADSRASALGYALSGQYEVPGLRRDDERWVYNLHLINDDVVDQDTRQYSLGASRFDTWRGFVRQLYSNYSRERFDIGSNGAESTLLIVGASLRHHEADDPLFVSRGYSLLFDLHGGLDSVGSDTSFVQGSLTLRGVYTLKEKTRLLGHFAYGVTSVDNFDQLPLGERFFTGGDRSVRGYKFQSLSPEDADDNALGGRFMIAAGVEIERMLYGDYGIAGFVDTGNASNETLPTLKTSVGLGFRYRAPIGMVRIDVAHPLDDDEHDYRLHISIGSDL